MKVADPAPVPGERVGRPRDSRLHDAILDATRELLTTGSYAELSMESVAARAGVGKRRCTGGGRRRRRWSPKRCYRRTDGRGRSGRTDRAIRDDLQTRLDEHAEFLAEPSNAALVRALVADTSGPMVEPHGRPARCSGARPRRSAGRSSPTISQTRAP
ncbi:TetR family transcriptional regulator [Mycobacterium tilburgii]|uniref:TetR family transcriptional regulator n=1 Tax=Mycobacterium tilburgii TaxID=44467 RepID=UPI0038994307